MRVLVPIKRVVDQQVRVEIKPDGSQVDTAHASMVMNHFDAIALEQAVRWQEAGLVQEIIAVSIGSPDNRAVLQHALAMGANRARLLMTELSWEPLNIAKILQFVVQDLQPDLVLLGKQATDLDYGQTAAILGGLLAWPQALNAAEISLDAGQVEVVSEMDQGSLTSKLLLPAVISVDLRLNQPRYPSLPKLLKARKEPIEQLDVSQILPELRSRQKILKVIKPRQERKKIQLQNTQELFELLKAAEQLWQA